MKTYIKAYKTSTKGTDLIKDSEINNGSTWSSEKIDNTLNGTLTDYLYYEDITIENPTWNSCGNVFYASSLKTFDSSMRDKIVSAQITYWTGFHPWLIFDHYNSAGDFMTINLFSAENASGSCRVRIWYKK